MDFLKTAGEFGIDLFACIRLIVGTKFRDNPWYIFSYKTFICLLDKQLIPPFPPQKVSLPGEEQVEFCFALVTGS